MGISDLSKFLKKRNIYYIVNSDIFLNKKIAIDFSIWVYDVCMLSKLNTIGKTPTLESVLLSLDDEYIFKEMIKKIIDKIDMFLSNYMLPVLIFDGKSTINKLQTKIKRIEKAEEYKKKNTDAYNKIYGKYFKTEDLMKDFPTTFSSIIDSLKKYSMYSRFPTHLVHKIQFFLTKIGLPYFYAVGEADKLCSSLVRDSYVSVAFSSDSDFHAHGCPLVIKKIDGKGMKCSYLPNILNSLNFSFEQFREFCIMCGCDYNEKIPGWGPEKCYKLIKTYVSIDRIPENIHGNNISRYNVEVCRKEFKQYASYKLIDNGFLDYSNGKIIDKRTNDFNTNQDFRIEIKSADKDFLNLVNEFGLPSSHFNSIIEHLSYAKNINRYNEEEIVDIEKDYN